MLKGVKADDVARHIMRGQSIFYAESWAVVDWLIRRGSSNVAALYAFLTDAENGTPMSNYEPGAQTNAVSIPSAVSRTRE